jgi:hypothetical protein
LSVKVISKGKFNVKFAARKHGLPKAVTRRQRSVAFERTRGHCTF